MSNPDFSKIRFFANGQREAFEDLVCHLAGFEPPEVGSRWLRFRGSGGDGGVECIWVRPDGRKWGLQSKFLGGLDKAQLAKSFLAAVKNHPELDRYTFCLPFDLTGPRTQGTAGAKSETEHMDGWITEWRATALASGVVVAIDYWSASAIALRLVRNDPHGGLRRFFFDETFLPSTFPKRHLEEAVAQAGKRYSPELSVEVPITQALEDFGQTNEWRAQIAQLRRELSRSLESWENVLSPHPHAGVDPFPPEHQGKAGTLLLQGRSIVSRLREPSIEALKSAASVIPPMLEVLEQCRHAAAEQLAAKHGIDAVTSDRFREYEASYNARFPAQHVDNCVELRAALQGTLEWLEESGLRLASSQTMVIGGPAGVGKTHAIVDHALSRAANGFLSIVLFGESFDAEPWQVIARRLGHHSIDREQLFSTLNAAGSISGFPLIIFVDALNETEPRTRWAQWLPGLVAQLTVYPWLKLCISCRDIYFEQVGLSDSKYPVVYHDGFARVQQEAARRFFEYYKLALPVFPLIEPEFSNPLFLHLVCSSFQAVGRATGPTGQDGIAELVNVVLTAKNAVIARRLDYETFENRVKPAVLRIAREMASRGSRHLPWTTARDLVDGKPSVGAASVPRELSMFAQLEREGLLARSVGPSVTVRFTFEFLADFLVASALIDGLEAESYAANFGEGGSLAYLIATRDAQLENQGVLEALSVLMPERGGGELAEIGRGSRPHLLICTMNALGWRTQASFSENSKNLMLDALSSHLSSAEAFEALLRTACRPAVPINAEFLHQILEDQELVERDSWFALKLHDSFSANRNVARLLEWALLSDLSYLDETTAGLWATILGWFLSAADRRVRDRATKALVRLLAVHPQVAPSVLARFLAVNDLYVVERALAAAYAFLLRVRTTDVVNSHAEALVKSITETDFDSDHALIRDYVFLIRDRCLALGIDAERLPGTPISTLPVDWPAPAEDANYAELLKAPNMNLSNQLVSDFGNYVVRPRVVDRFKVEGKDVHRWFYREVLELGYPGRGSLYYDHKMFAKGLRRKPTWAERIGKKYYWILLNRLVARLCDSVSPTARSGWGEDSELGLCCLSLRDIDPTDFLHIEPNASMPSVRDIVYDHEGALDVDDPVWVHNDEFFELKNTVLVEHGGHEWITLDAHYAWTRVMSQEPDGRYPYRHVSFSIRSALVKDADFEDVKAALNTVEASNDYSNLFVQVDDIFIEEYPYSFVSRALHVWRTRENDEACLRWEPTAIHLSSKYENDCSSPTRGSTLLLPSWPFFDGEELTRAAPEAWSASDRGVVLRTVRSSGTDILIVRRDFLDSLLERRNMRLVWISYQEKLVHYNEPRSAGASERWSSAVWSNGVEDVGHRGHHFPPA